MGQTKKTSQKGQLVLEYILLMLVTVGLSLSISNLLIKKSADPQEQGLIISVWSSTVAKIAADYAGEL